MRRVGGWRFAVRGEPPHAHGFIVVGGWRSTANRQPPTANQKGTP